MNLQFIENLFSHPL